jgi:acetyl esterase/lipase
MMRWIATCRLILLSDATRLRDALRESDVQVTLDVWPDMWHGWHAFLPYLPEARDAVDGIGMFVRERVNSW